jgi:probable F420-dependent oxidoreductase
MPRIEFGPVYTSLDDVIAPGEFAKQAERFGYDAVWAPEFVLRRHLDPLIALTAMAAATSRVRLGTAVVVLPYRHPILLAKAALSVDAVSGGRLTLGVGIGFIEPEFAALGVAMRERGKRSDESLEALGGLLAGGSATFAGRYYRFSDVALRPRPGAGRRIPIWIGGEWWGGMAEGVLRRVARFADGFVPAEIPAAAYREVQTAIAERASSAGRDPARIEWSLFLWLCLADDQEKARATASEELARRHGRATPLEPGAASALGTPRDCIEAIEAYADIGVTHFVLGTLAPPAQALEQLEAFASDVLPHFR